MAVPAPAAYTPGHLAERIARSAAALAGERKQVSILFADLKGSLELIANRDPEDARTLLDPMLTLMMDAVHAYEGTVNQVMGDGVMALFGAPIAHEDHAVRACHAALRMQEALQRDAARLQRESGVPVRIRVGINSGEVVVRAIGSDLRMDYSAVGETTHIAARMEQLAPAGTIYIASATRRLVHGYVETRPVGELAIKGLSEPLAVHEVLAATVPRSRFEVAVTRGLTTFSGRAEEMAELGRGLARVAAGPGEILAIVGDAGVGKSRLVWEFLRTGALDGWQVLQTAAAPYSSRRGYAPVRDLLAQYFGLRPPQSTAAIRDVVAGALDAAEGGRFLPTILGLLDASHDDDRWPALEPDQRRRRTLEAVTHLLRRAAQTRPVCVVVEDLHWIDAETEAVLHHVAAGLGRMRVLLLLTSRTEYQPGWPSAASCRQIRVDALSLAGAGAILDSLLGPDAGLAAPLKAALLERSGCNPLFLEESVRHLTETGVLSGEPGAFRLRRPLDLTTLPATIQAVVAARIDRLMPEDKVVLQAAAALGKQVPHWLLDGMTDASVHDLDAGLARLRRSEFLDPLRLLPEPEDTFRHPLVLEVVYAGLLRERRRTLDARAVETIERRAPRHLAEHLDRLAHHAYRGELWDKALTYCRRAGAAAFTRSAHRAAVAYFEQALTALGHLPSTPALVEEAVDIHLELRQALSPLGEYRKMSATLAEAARLAGTLHDQRRLGVISSFLCNYATLRGDFASAVQHGERALAIARDTSEAPVEAVTSAILGLAFYGRGEYRRAIDTIEPRLPLHDTGRDQRVGMALSPPVYARTIMAWSLAELGQLGDGRAVAAEALGMAERLDHPHSVIFACLGAGVVHVRAGESAPAIGVLERAYRIWETADLPAVLLEVAGPLASAYAQGGRAEEAIILLERAIGQAVELRHRVGHVLASGGLAEAYLAAGRLEDALTRAQLFVEITRTVMARGSCAWAHYLLAEILTRIEPARADDAQAALDTALALSGELGMRPLEARLLRVQARHLGRLGRHDEAGAARREATARFSALAMSPDAATY